MGLVYCLSHWLHVKSFSNSSKNEANNSFTYQHRLLTSSPSGLPDIKSIQLVEAASTNGDPPTAGQGIFTEVGNEGGVLVVGGR